MALNTSIVFDWSAVLTAARDLGNASIPLAKRVALALASGVGANQADVVFADTRTIGGSATDELDLIGGGLVDGLGAAFAPVKIKAILVVAAGANANVINVQRPAANGLPLFLAASDGIPVRPGGVFAWVAPDATGIPVTTGTGDLLDLVNTGAGNVTYDIILVGTSA